MPSWYWWVMVPFWIACFAVGWLIGYLKGRS